MKPVPNRQPGHGGYFSLQILLLSTDVHMSEEHQSHVRETKEEHTRGTDRTPALESKAHEVPHTDLEGTSDQLEGVRFTTPTPLVSHFTLGELRGKRKDLHAS